MMQTCQQRPRRHPQQQRSTITMKLMMTMPSSSTSKLARLSKRLSATRKQLCGFKSGKGLVGGVPGG
eukprot:3940973-Rhodomonas_salina.6